MQWSEIINTHPEQWLLVEALEAHSEGSQRILDDIATLNAFDDSKSAMDIYRKFHHQTQNRELYVLHTSKETLAITERVWSGIRR